MANVNGPFGLVQWGTGSGPPNFAQNGNTPYRIASNNATAIFFGDLVTLVVAPTGYITQWTAGAGSNTVQVAGVFYGCRYYSTSQRKTVWNNYWPGSDATGDVEAFVCDDPVAQFVIQASAGPITQATIGQTADVVVGSGNTTTGISAMALDTPTTTATLPLKVVNLVTSPPGVNGRDVSTAYNLLVVTFNNMTMKTLQGV